MSQLSYEERRKTKPARIYSREPTILDDEVEFDFGSLPLNLKISILRVMPEDEFRSMCSLPELEYLCIEEPYASRVYRERTEHFYPALVKFKPEDMKWKDFYERMKVFVEILPSLTSWGRTRLALMNQFLELKILEEIANAPLPEIHELEASLYQENVEHTLLLMTKYGLHPENIESTSWRNLFRPNLIRKAIAKDAVLILDYAFSNGKYPTLTDYIEAIYSGALKSLDWLYDHNFIPTNISEQHKYDMLVYANDINNREVAKWLKNHNLLPNFIDDTEINSWLT